MKTKKFLVGITAAALLFASPGASFADTSNGFLDVPSTDVNYTYIMDLYQHGKVQGTGNGNFSPKDSLTRAEFVTMIERAFGVQSSNQAIPFKDVKSGDWFYQHVIDAYAAKITVGVSPTQFAPNQTLSREEAATMVWNYLDAKNLITLNSNASKVDASDADVWAKPAVQNVLAYGFRSDSNPLYSSKKTMSRGDAAALIDLAMNEANRQKASKGSSGTGVNGGLGLGNPTSNTNNIIDNADGTKSLGNIHINPLNEPVDRYTTSLNLLKQVKFTVNGEKVTIVLPATGTNTLTWSVHNYDGSDANTITVDYSTLTDKSICIGITDNTNSNVISETWLVEQNGQFVILITPPKAKL